MTKLSKHAILLAGVFSAFVTISTVSSQAQTQAPSATLSATPQKMPALSAEQQQEVVAAQAKAQAEMDRFNKMTPAEQKAYMEKAQKQADEQFDRISKNLTPEQKTALEAARGKAKAEMERFNKMTPAQKKVYMEKAKEQIGVQVQNMTPAQQK